MMFGGDLGAIVGVCSAIYPGATEQNFYAFYLGLGVVPFNLLRCLLMSLLTFLLYKRLSVLLHWEGRRLTRRISGEYRSHSEEDTYAVAERIAATLNGGETILLSGDLGAGKTTFVKGLAEALGVEEEVTSPTFTLLNVYTSGRLPLYHADMYRAEDEDETYELGLFEDAPEDAVRVIEWNKSSDLTDRVIDVRITSEGDSRRLIKVADSAEGADTAAPAAGADDAVIRQAPAGAEDLSGLEPEGESGGDPEQPEKQK